MKDLNNVVLTESTAKKYFGSVDNAMGKIITLNKETPLKVTGIAKDVPSNSHLYFDIVTSLERYKECRLDDNVDKQWCIYIHTACSKCIAGTN